MYKLCTTHVIIYNIRAKVLFINLLLLYYYFDNKTMVDTNIPLLSVKSNNLITIMKHTHICWLY